MRALLLILQVVLSSAAVLRVDQSTSLQSVLSQSSPGDTLSVQPGIYSGPEYCNLLIEKEGIRLFAPAGPGQTILDCGHQSRCIMVSGVSVEISGLTLRNGEARDAAAQTRRVAPRRPLPVPKDAAEEVLVAVIKVFVRKNGSIVRRISGRSRGKRTRSSIGDRNDKAHSWERDSLPSIFDSSRGGCLLATNSAKLVLRNVIVSGGRAVQGSGVAAFNSQIEMYDSAVTLNSIFQSTRGSFFATGGFHAEQSASIIMGNCSVFFCLPLIVILSFVLFCSSFSVHGQFH